MQRFFCKSCLQKVFCLRRFSFSEGFRSQKVLFLKMFFSKARLLPQGREREKQGERKKAGTRDRAGQRIEGLGDWDDTHTQINTVQGPSSSAKHEQ